jgi:DNA primase
VVTLPPGEDPDTMVRRQGPAALRAQMDNALDVLDRKLQILAEKDFFSSIERTRKAVDALLPTLRAAADPALRDIYVAKVADRTGVRRETLEREMARPAAGAQRAPRAEAPAPAAPRAPRLAGLGAERTLLLLMTKNPEYVERAGEQLGAEDFVDPAYRAIFQALLTDPELRAPPTSMDPVAAQRFQEILEDPEEIGHAGRVFDDAVARVRVATLGRALGQLDRRIEQADDDGEKMKLMEEKSRLSGELRALAPQDWTMTTRRLRGDPNPSP